jgi:mono/diheme cytochrome c family protein
MTGKLISTIVLASLCLNGMVRPAIGQAVLPPPPIAQRMAPPMQIIQPIAPPVATAPVPAGQPQPNPLDLLVWDALQKDQTTEPGQLTADFIFKVSNPSETPVEITDVRTSCGCTVAKLPSKPWVLVPHTNGEIAVSVNLAGKAGVFTKTITVLSSNEQKVLIVQVHMPENPAITRMQNQQLAAADPQRVFKGDCAECHFKPTAGLMGKALYVKACGICHEAQPRATMVTDLHNMTHPTDYAYWKVIIANGNGKPLSAMPAFAVEHGGPLSDAQIDSLAKTLTQSFPFRGAATEAAAATPIPVNQYQMMGTPPPTHN